MKNYIIRRILQMIPVFFGILILLFLILEKAPGGPLATLMDPRMTPARKAELAEALGLNRSLPEKFASWVKEAAQGNLGYSISHKKPVLDVIGDYIGSTFTLAISSLIFAMIVGIPAGIICATKQYSKLDYVLTIISLIGISMPSFFFALLLLKTFAVDVQIFPLYGKQNPLLFTNNPIIKFFDVAYHLVLPVLILGLSSAASFMRYTRSSMLEVIKQDYVRTARAKGLKEKVVIYRHALRNAIIPIITLLGFSIPMLFSGAVITESIFALPGLGKISVEATMNRNYPLILGINTILALITLLSSLIADILYAVADPRIRFD